MNAVPWEAYADALREDVCSICVCFSPDSVTHHCLNENTGACVIFAHLDETIRIVSRFEKSDLPALETAFQMYVCTQCKLSDVEGVCSLRDRTKPIPEWCMADAYLPQVVGAVERAQQVEV